MYRIDWTLEALADLDRLEDFLFDKSPLSADRAVYSITSAVDQLTTLPLRGRIAGDFRELVVRFSSGGYVVRYIVAADVVSVIAVRSQRELDHPPPHP
jgi:plasmid stabilization system protein ParE